MKRLYNENFSNEYFVDVIPEVCPFCNRAVDFSYNWIATNSFHHNFDFSNLRQRFVDIIFKCPSLDCCRVTVYSYSETNPVSDELTFTNYYISKKYFKATVFPDSITKISPKFVEIYNQAIIAESNMLNEIVGLSLRKSFEFLIKDFIISELNGDDSLIDEVKMEKRFDKLLNNYFEDDSRIQSLSKRVAWLGNDEAHYLRIRTEHDIKDLKMLIHLVINYIDSDCESKRYISEITPMK